MTSFLLKGNEASRGSSLGPGPAGRVRARPRQQRPKESKGRASERTRKMGGRGRNSGMSNSTGQLGIQRAYSVDSSKYSGYAKTLAREADEAIRNDDEDRWLVYTNTTSRGESFIQYSLEDNYIAGLGSTRQGSGATNLLISALEDIQKYGDDRAPVEWLVYSDDSIKYYDRIGLSKYRTRDTYRIPQSDITKVVNNLRRR